MGQKQDHFDSSGNDRRKSSQGQEIRRNPRALGQYLCAIVGISAVVSACAFSAGGSSTANNPSTKDDANVSASQQDNTNAADESQNGKTASAPETAFDKTKAWSHLLKQVEFGPRVPGTDGHVKCRDYIQEEMKKSCENVRLQELTHVWSSTRAKKTMWNIIGEQGWKDAKVHAVVIAHWDTRPTADQEWTATKQQMPIPGANDGASGVAVLLELMRVMKDKRPADLGIMYLMSDGEDLGPGLDEMFLGAKYFAKNLPTPKPDYGILLDMIGDKMLTVPMEPNSMSAAEPLMNAFYDYAGKIGLSSTFPKMTGPEIYDDHLSIIQAGVPTIDLIDFTYDAWHTLDDTPDKCSADSLGKVGKMLESWFSQKTVWAYPKS